MNEITISIYSYKGKKLFETIDTLIKNCSKETKLIINVKDQHPMNRERSFKEILAKGGASGSYHHVFWDWIKSPIIHKDELLRIAKTEYHLFLGDNVSLEQGWDKELINNLKGNSVISGKNKVLLNYKNLFYLDKSYLEKSDFILNNYIDRDMIFGKTKTVKSIDMPKFLKYDGEEEVMTIICYEKGIDIYASPNYLYHHLCPTSIGNLYSTFSLSHNYNVAIDLMRTHYNFFKKYHNLDTSKIKSLPFDTNDVAYDPNEAKYDKIDGRRFIDKQNAIN